MYIVVSRVLYDCTLYNLQCTSVCVAYSSIYYLYYISILGTLVYIVVSRVLYDCTLYSVQCTLYTVQFTVYKCVV